jgi:hypothetical protein
MNKRVMTAPPPEGKDSWEELYIEWYLQELKEAGYILKYEYQPETFLLSPAQKYAERVMLKTKNRIDEHSILQPHSYTPDYRIFWNSSAIGVFCKILGSSKQTDGNHKKAHFWSQLNEIGVPVSIIDVKPMFDMQNMTRLFVINQKWVYAKYDTYCQKVMHEHLFEKTFCPFRFTKTNKSMRDRKLKFVPISLFEFLLGKNR